MKVIFADAGYAGKCAKALERKLGWQIEVAKKESQGRWQQKGQPPPKKNGGFEVLKWRWIVERTFAWLGRCRRLSKDYEHLESSSEAWILIAMSQLMWKRLST